VRLRVDDIGTFDGSPSGTTAVAYCRRLTFLGTYGEQPVLATLPLCMREKALNWFSGLNEDVATLMAENLEEWKLQLIRQFNANASQALSKADAMKYSFADESALDVREYITEKQNLYVAAGKKDEDLIVRRIHDGLDPTLASTISY